MLFCRGDDGRTDPAPVTIPVRMFPLLPPGAGTVHRGSTGVGNFILHNHQLKQVLTQKLLSLAVKSEQVVEERINHLPEAGAGGPKDSLVCRPRIACTQQLYLFLLLPMRSRGKIITLHVPPAQGALLAD